MNPGPQRGTVQKHGEGRPRRWRISGSGGVAAVLLAALVFAAHSAEPLLVRSRSGQFVVRGVSVIQPLVPAVSTTQVAYARLDPAVVTVSLERVKQALLTELAMNDAWKGSVSVVIHPYQRDNEPITVTSTRYADGWTYRMDVPELVDKDRFIKAVVQVLLMEIANRRSGEQPVPMPPWLGPGLVAHMRATSLSSFNLEPQTSVVSMGKRIDHAQRAREILRAASPLTFDDLNLPTEDHLHGEAAVVYECSAHLLIQELLSLRGGRSYLRDMLFMLVEHHNWQTAFLRAFAGHFPRLIDADKWWSVQVVSFTGRDAFSLWPEAQSWSRLDEILATHAEVRTRPDELPLKIEVKLQTLISEWTLSQQAAVLAQKISQLQALRLRVVPELASLVDEYRFTLEDYVRQRSQIGVRSESKHQPPPNARMIVKQAIRRLDEMDSQREALRRSASAKPRRSSP